MVERYIASNRLWMAMVAGRAGRPRGRAEPREDDVWRRLDGRRARGRRRRGRAGVDHNDGGAGAAEMMRSTL